MLTRVFLGFITLFVTSHLIGYSKRCDIEIILNRNCPEFTVRKVHLCGSNRAPEVRIKPCLGEPG
jgi:hypothetical protein